MNVTEGTFSQGQLKNKSWFFFIVVQFKVCVKAIQVIQLEDNLGGQKFDTLSVKSNY